MFWKKTKQNKKVFVGMSGGVDSSVSAALLKEQGYDVVGVFMKVWSPKWLPCTWPAERRDAMRAAAKLKIPFLTFDFEEEYKRGVVDYMIAEYKAGRVPNPDVMCNKIVKFDAFLKKAESMGADFIATGHYAKVVHEKGISKMLAGVDKEKDQTYFLWTLNQSQLKKTLFPIGDFLKTDVRNLARKFALDNAEKKDSQGLCFMGKLDIKDFLKKYIDEKPGDVLNEKGDIIGSHDGSTFYTMGQRHGFLVTKKGTDDDPYFVISKNVEKNTITVSNSKNVGPGYKNDIPIKDVNWTLGSLPDLSKKYKARIRYRQPLQDCTIVIDNDNVSVIFDKEQESVASGQSVVIYDNEVCLGGCIIE